jgi:hypothetical protein
MERPMWPLRDLERIIAIEPEELTSPTSLSDGQTTDLGRTKW